MKKILIFIPSVDLRGGMEKVAIGLGFMLKEQYEISFLILEKINNHSNLDFPITSFSQPSNRILKYIYIFYNMFLLKRYCKNYNIDVIISHGERANIISLLSKKVGNNIKMLNVVHNYKYSFDFIFKYLIKILYKYSNRIICVSESIKFYLKKEFMLDNIETIYNPIFIEDIKRLGRKNVLEKDEKYFKKGYTIFLNIGRLTEQKGQENLIKAFKKVLLKKPKSILLILGNGELKDNLQKNINNLGLDKNIFLLGNRKNPYPYIKRSKIFIFSSLWEGFGLVLVEALIFNKRIVSTDCKVGPREILCPELNINKNITYPYHGKFGCITPVMKNDNDINIFSNAILETMNNTIIKGNDSINRFNIKKSVKKWKKIIN